MTPARGVVLLKPIETPEQFGHILLIPKTRDDWTAGQMEVVAIGAPAYCVDADCDRCNRLAGKALWSEAFTHPTSAKAGDWVLVRHRALSDTHESGLFACHQDDLLAVLSS